MTKTEALTANPTTATAATATTATASAATAGGAQDRPVFQPVPVWFFAFEGLMGASYDVIKSSHCGWVFLAVGAAVNIVLARTVLRGRLKMAKAMLKGKRTRMLAIGLIALRVGVHVLFGAIGVAATSGVAHVCLAVGMCAATVGLLAFDQRVMLRALNAQAQAAPAAGPAPAVPATTAAPAVPATTAATPA